MKGHKKSTSAENVTVDFGIGGLNIGGLFHDLEELIERASELQDEGAEIKQEAEIDFGALKEGMRGVFGISIRTVAGGKVVIDPFGNIKKTANGPTVGETREPLTESSDTEEAFIIIDEMPGVEEADIILKRHGEMLDISTQGSKRKYHKKVLLPAHVKPETLSSSYKNGILEIRIQK